MAEGPERFPATPDERINHVNGPHIRKVAASFSPETPWSRFRYCSSIWILIHSVFTRFLASWTISRPWESRSAAVLL